MNPNAPNDKEQPQTLEELLGNRIAEIDEMLQNYPNADQRAELRLHIMDILREEADVIPAQIEHVIRELKLGKNLRSKHSFTDTSHARLKVELRPIVDENPKVELEDPSVEAVLVTEMLIIAQTFLDTHPPREESGETVSDLQDAIGTGVAEVTGAREEDDEAAAA